MKRDRVSREEERRKKPRQRFLIKAQSLVFSSAFIQGKPTDPSFIPAGVKTHRPVLHSSWSELLSKLSRQSTPQSSGRKLQMW